MSRCAICYTRIEDSEAVTKCSECQQLYHAGCWNEVGGCGTYGCAEAAVAEKPPPPVVLGQGWGYTKSCPACQRDIGASLLVCQCGVRFPYADPMTADEYHSWHDEQQLLRRARRTIATLFVITLLGVPAIVTGSLAGVYAARKRDVLEGESGGTFLAMGYGCAAIGATYAVVALMLFLGL